MQYWIVGGIGAVVAVALGILLNKWDNSRYEAAKENAKKDEKTG